ncbi:MAG: S10 family peptidase [Terriglobales bacterium]
MRNVYRLILFATITIPLIAQQTNPPAQRVKKTAPSNQPEATKPSSAEPNPTEQAQQQQQKPAEKIPEETRPSPSQSAQAEKPAENVKYDMTELPPVVTHHQITVDGKLLHYTATAGRLPIKEDGGTIEAEMFYVAYTLDGAAPGTRPLTFAFNGGPGSASVWLHMGALGPRKVVMQPEGWMPPAPYRLEDNANTPLDRTDLVLVDAIGTGWSRPADTNRGKKFWGVKGDIQSFSEFIRLYITRNERWSSPLYLLGESYGTTRSAGISGYLQDKGISFNGIILLSSILRFNTVETTVGNDEAYALTLPSYTMIAAYHKKLPPELMQDLAKTRAEVEKWVLTDYMAALHKGDTLTPQERSAIEDQISRYTGLSKTDVDEANLRVDVRWFTHRLLAGEKLRVGRLDGRYAGPDPQGYLDTPFYDPSGSASMPPFTSTFYEYIRRDLNYKTDMPYIVLSREANQNWEWGKGIEGMPDTATDLRAAMVKDPYLKVLVMEGYYDLATPYFASSYTMEHMDLSDQYRKNISFATYQAGHMVYMKQSELQKMKHDVVSFVDATLPK